MSGQPWTQDEQKILLDGHNRGLLGREIAVELHRAGFTRSLDSVIGKLGRVQAELPAQLPVTIPAHRRVGVPHDGAPLRKVLFLSDTHIPFQLDFVIEHALETHGDADLLVLGGDILDMYETSKWSHSQDLSTRDEVATARDWLVKLSSKIGRVAILGGNHEHRLTHYLTSRLAPGVIQALGSSSTALGLVTSGVPGITTASSDLPWMLRVGRAVFAHPSHASSVPMRTAIATLDYLARRGDHPQALVIGHTHQQGTLWHSGCMLIEAGCACKPMSYDGHPKLLYRNPQVCGYAVVALDEAGNLAPAGTYTVYCGSYTLAAATEVIL